MSHRMLDRWLDILSDEPNRIPDVRLLYHYTDAIGLHGIISSHRLWATAAQFSNDLSEIDYALTLAREVIKEVWGHKASLSAWEQLLRDHVQGFFAGPFPDFNQPFLVSFCEDGDLLSQWRAYGHRTGFSLGFKLYDGESVLVRCEKGFRTLLRKVVYDPDVQRERLRLVLEKLIKLANDVSDDPLTDEKNGNPLHSELSLILILELSEWASTVKHNAFSEEREWRLISFPAQSAKVGGVSIRATSELLVPYMILGAVGGNSRLPIVEVRCGPSPLQSESARAVGILLTKQGYGSLPITCSKIPLRV
jgi:hypothetical protein